MSRVLNPPIKNPTHRYIPLLHNFSLAQSLRISPQYIAVNSERIRSHSWKLEGRQAVIFLHWSFGISE